MLQRLRRFAAPRLAKDADLGGRLTLAGVAAGTVTVPFLLLFLLVEDRWPPLRRLDEGVAQSLNDVAVRSDRLVEALRLVSDVLSPTTFRVAAVVLALWLLRQRLDRLAVWVVVTVGGSSLLGLVAKELAGRQRPVLDHPVASAPGLSYPSGHALGSFVGVAVLLLVLLPLVPPRWRPAAWTAAVLAVLSVGFARVGLGVHFTSDVLGGWLLGTAWIAATTVALSAWRHRLGRRGVHVTKGLEPESADRLVPGTSGSPR